VRLLEYRQRWGLRTWLPGCLAFGC